MKALLKKIFKFLDTPILKSFKKQEIRFTITYLVKFASAEILGGYKTYQKEIKFDAVDYCESADFYRNRDIVEDPTDILNNYAKRIAKWEIKEIMSSGLFDKAENMIIPARMINYVKLNSVSPVSLYEV